MKPKKINDQRDSSDLRSKTPFSSSTSTNSANGLRSGKAISEAGKASAVEGLRDCQSAQYPEPARAMPTTAAATSTATMSFSRVMSFTPDPAPYAFVRQSDQCFPSASILPAEMSDLSRQWGMSCSNMMPRKALPQTTTSRSFWWNPA